MLSFMNKIRSIPAILDIDNVDTDMIIPKQFLKTITRIGLGKYLFFEKRYNSDGSINEDFILNKSPFDRSEILISGKNFGCGSSREHAPWSLKDFGIKCIIAESLADIFYNNCFENQILPIFLNEKDIEKLIKSQEKNTSEIEINVDEQIIKSEDLEINFEIDQSKKYKFINNLDTIGETLTKINLIEKFEKDNDF